MDCLHVAGQPQVIRNEQPKIISPNSQQLPLEGSVELSAQKSFVATNCTQNVYCCSRTLPAVTTILTQGMNFLEWSSVRYTVC